MRDEDMILRRIQFRKQRENALPCLDSAFSVGECEVLFRSRYELQNSG
jgi:hypothetical protein